MSDSKVFGTPPEPLFNHRVCGVRPDMMQDWMTMLNNKNAKVIANAKSVIVSYVCIKHCISTYFQDKLVIVSNHLHRTQLS